MDKIEEFLRRYPKQSTRKSYNYSLRSYFKTINKDCNTYLDDINAKTLENDLITFIDSLSCHPTTKRDHFLRVKKFLNANDVALKQSFFDDMKLRIGKKTTVGDEKIPTKGEIKEIVSFGGIKEKALVLTMLSSGIRIGELLQIPLDDFHLDESPSRIFIRGEYAKGGLKRDTFISDEATESIRSWLKVRKKYLSHTIKKTKALSHIGDKSREDNRIFPMSYNNALVIWSGLLRKAGLDEKDSVTGNTLRHLHTLRKYFRTQLGAIIAVDAVETLMGHSGYLTKAYRRYTRDELREFYKQGESAVTILGTSPHNHERISQLEDETRVRKQDANVLRDEIRILREEIDLKDRRLELIQEIITYRLENTDIKVKNGKAITTIKPSAKFNRLKKELKEINIKLEKQI